MSSLHDEMVQSIVKQQEQIIGPLAWSEAKKVGGLVINNNMISVTGDGKKVLDGLVSQFEALFGQASVEACKDAVRSILPKMSPEEIPSKLK